LDVATQSSTRRFLKQHPLIWNIEFAEVFYEKSGFDIIIGNPPYVRQEDIGDPYGNLQPKDYKAAMQQIIRDEYPDYFRKKEPIDGKSDLYAYFYLKTLRLLNPQGVHCFICSNSWLDVGYGVWMQKFMLNHCRVHFVIDNHAIRSFANADVNTIISVMDAPVKNRKTLDSTFEYKFVAFKKPFEEVIFSDNLIAIDNQQGAILNNEAFRSYPVSIKDLLEEGSEYEENKEMDTGVYVGDKWGGKYLRAPDIFFTILEKGKDKFVRLGTIAEVKFGIKTGCNEFFYLTKEDVDKWKIEDEFLKPVIKSPQECKNYLVTDEHLKFRVFLCNKPKEELKGTNALKYIEHGETMEIEVSQGGTKGKIIGVHNLQSVLSRRMWYSLGELAGNTFWIKETNDRLAVFNSDINIIADCRLYFGNFNRNHQNYFNSIIYFLYSESMTRSGLGLGARSLMVFEVNQHKILYIEQLNNKPLLNRNVYNIFQESGIDPASPIPIEDQEPNPLPDRKELDDVIFDALDLDDEERKEVYRAVCRLVWNRVSKAKSTNNSN